MTAVIMAGGKGTRLSAVTKDEIPKPMAAVYGKPILQWQIEKLAENDIKKFVIVVGHLSEKIIDYFGDGSIFGVCISYYKEEVPLGTAGALVDVKKMLPDEDFLLVYGDVIFDINVDRMLSFHCEKESEATLLVHPNSHPYDSDLVNVSEDEKIVSFDSKNNDRTYYYNNLVNAGFYILSKSAFSEYTELKRIDLEKEVFRSLYTDKRAIYSYRSTEYIKDVGTVERIRSVEEDLKCGLVFLKNLGKKQKCIFLDRDGTLNVHKGLIANEKEIELLEGSEEAVKKINQSGYLLFLVTNQPVVARGLCSIEDVELMHKKISTLLGQSGGYLDDIVFCPHHPDRGFPEENPQYKIQCTCRKPKIGMLEDLIEKYNIDISNSWMVGDTTIDIQTGTNAGVKTVLVLTGEGGNDHKYQVVPDKTYKNLLEFCENEL